MNSGDSRRDTVTPAITTDPVCGMNIDPAKGCRRLRTSGASLPFLQHKLTGIIQARKVIKIPPATKTAIHQIGPTSRTCVRIAKDL